ncbi:MAG: hypothetical protein A3G52_01375 [Candidatus Taylorbacteria bacterium RIFCSPLOWO2_12_FULL_43_20]|uniref:Uncharacterized protein n=1 Tax=Candidatus Taylorbacteria bacterium RIFCSPLOWO2_12_FULL_43_20 TaxID=1802332 RepID=A0A1G2P1Y9_9BACT|nr:MAG: hypothetical protein A2825_01910 [Candidatus Taylorbacteria bacterium RIFCSPHIGHO2_01_FULL_43_120]OHA23804.1 MAG: hypothetical protein A3B98_04585 [Candidatus Taylorbacteria bacterium RIFCSPHIGHO2_02_FULL_43_55]OHA29527.1 MAG: hypothetical protein A3E92_01810 [Candidatus Taylorbacteria bacterium RIFCSPHIGHO2_12_FULL_42_34]OHA31330.1 MAG: hypothetical protein A3B09_02240 [Candidatus Taylorbacteria bacterium RIFCSPLOWO2_01_FULL_43_83]OHA38851.1 MAG: hypothetical protein A3H58_00480 [Candi
MQKHSVLDEAMVERLKSAKYTEKQIRDIEYFLHNLHNTARICIAALLVSLAAKKNKISFQEIMYQLVSVYNKNWERDDFKRRGDPDDLTDGRGLRNATLITSLYTKLGLPPPNRLGFIN